MKSRIYLCVLVLLLAVSQTRAEDKARVSSVSGAVTYAGSGAGSFSPLTAGTEIPIGSRVRTGSDGNAVIIVVSGAAMQIAENSEVTIEAMSSDAAKRKALVSLKTGTVSALIDPKRSKQTDFKIQTPQGVAAARGTFYGVTVQKGKTYVGVKKGKVGVAHTSKVASQNLVSRDSHRTPAL
jgi:hypothetical protein